jgi:hypothetical protein
MVTSPLDFDVLLLAPLAMVFSVAALWLLELVFIEADKRMLEKVRHQHESLARFTNFMGVLFQTLCHALGYTVTRSGIEHFQVTVNYGTVSPKKIKTGVFEWVSTLFLFLGPFFIPAGLMLLFSFFLLTDGFVLPASVQHTFVETLSNLGTTLSSFAQSVSRFLASIDLLNPVHVFFLLVLLFFGMGIRPSYIGEERKEKVNLLYDLKNITTHFTKKPVYIVAFFAGVYVLFYVSLALGNNWFVALFSLFGWMSVISIIALLLAFVLLVLVRASDEIASGWRMLPFLTLPIAYGASRAFFFYVPRDDFLGWSLLAMIVSTVMITIVLIKYKTNRFKTAGRMKHMRVADGKKRASKK